MDNKLHDLLRHLSSESYRTSQELSTKLLISERTVRSRIKEINDLIEEEGALIVSKPRFGYILEISDPEAWDDFLNAEKGLNGIPDDSQTRVQYILLKLLKTRDYVKLEDLSEQLFISIKTLSSEMKKIEYLIQPFGLWLEKKPYYGTRIAGSAYDRRNCFLQTFMITERSIYRLEEGTKQKIQVVAELLLKYTRLYNISFSEVAFHYSVTFLYLSWECMIEGNYIMDKPSYKINIDEEMNVVKNIYHELSYKYQKYMDIPIQEYEYAALYLAGSRFKDRRVETNVIISDETDMLVTYILNTLYHTYNVEFRDDFNLRILLNQHMVPLGIRLKYSIPIEHTILEEVKTKHTFAYTMAQTVGGIISSYYDAYVSEDEIACIAIYLALSMDEKKRRFKKKRNILLVCVSGRASSQMLMYKFKQEFGDYINSLNICNMYDFDGYDLSSIDFIFTTVPLFKSVPIPMMIISDFLQNNELMAVRDFLRIGDLSFLSNYYRREHFFAEVAGSSKKEVIYEICRLIREQRDLPEGFEESVMKREGYGPTDFGNYVAIPHPCEMLEDKNLVAVAVLKEEILWTSNKVRVVILTALSLNESDDSAKFYEITTSFLMNNKAVLSLIDDPTYDHFVDLMTDVGLMKE
ncbi:MAG: BglG family transcription antiterminator [Erysipelotrichaceae bacterium]|nr:BglG family transcription antiterminator [Erysipelotrichaceae bacterium]